MSKETRKAESLLTRANFDPKTYDEKENTIDVVFATEFPVRRRNWDGTFLEVLSCDKDHVNLERLNAGAPVVDSHYTGSIREQIGVVLKAWVDGKECRATIKLSTREDLKPVVEDIKNGIIKNISVGYRVYTYEITEKEGQLPTYRAIEWEAHELSFVTVPADYKSTTRSENENASFNDVTIIRSPKQNPTMDKKTTEGQGNAQTENRSVEQTNSAPDVVDTAKIRSEAVQAERKRVSEIQLAVRNAKLDASFAVSLVESGVTIDEARKQIIDKLAEADTTSVRSANAVVTNDTEAEQERTAIQDALIHRSAPGSVKLEGKAHDFKHMKMLDLARHFVEKKHGGKTYGLSQNELIHRAISTTDFPDLLTSTVNRQLRRYFAAAPQNWKPLAQQTSVSDFRAKTGLRVDGKLTLEEISEGGEYKSSKLMQDEKATIKVKTYGRLLKITRQSIINDDLDVFSRVPLMFAQGAANMQSDMVWALIVDNAKTPDNTVLFHATHGNLAAGGGNVGAPTEALLNNARVAMMRQKSPAGEIISVVPSFFIVPPELEMTAKKLMTAITASNTSDVNTMQNAFTILTEPRLVSAAAWYLAATPQSQEGIMYAYLDGEEGLHTESQTNFNTDDIETKARMEFGVSVWDYRGWYKNPGA